MAIAILAVGALASPMKEAAAEYEKRLSRFDKVTIHEVKEEREPQPFSQALVEKAVQKEGERLLRLKQPGDQLIALCIDGPQYASEVFAERMKALFDMGRRPAFVIGGSNGLSTEVIAASEETMSLSSLTFPHQLARVLLLEQMYRARKIIAGERYHK